MAVYGDGWVASVVGEGDTRTAGGVAQVVVAGEEWESEADREVEVGGVVGGELMGAGDLGEGGGGSGGGFGDEVDVEFVEQVEELGGLGFGEDLAAFADEDGVGDFEPP